MVRGGLELLLGGLLVSCVQPVSNDDSQSYTPSDDDSTMYDDTIPVDDDDYTQGDDDVGDDDTTGNLPPVAEAGGPYYGTVDDIMYFDFGPLPEGTGSYDPDGEIGNYDVDWGNGVTVSCVISQLIMIFHSQGIYDLILTVQDNFGVSSMDTTKVYIE